MKRAFWLERSGYGCIAFGIILLFAHGVASSPARPVPPEKMPAQLPVATPPPKHPSPSRDGQGVDVRPVPWIDTLKFDPSIICNDAVDKTAAIDRSEFDGDWFDIVLREGCYGPTVRMPKTWRSWRHQSANDETGWVSFSLMVYNFLTKTKPVKLNEEVRDSLGFADTKSEFRLQGKGTVRFIKVK